MWKAEHRVACDRRGLRYPSDLSDAEWALIAPFVPPARRGGRKRHVDMREVLNGIFYVLSTGCQWSALPKDLPPKSTVHDYFILLDCSGRAGACSLASHGYVLGSSSSSKNIFFWKSKTTHHFVMRPAATHAT